MWFEILPSAGIIVGVMAIPAFGLYGLQKFFLGNPYRRNTDERFDRVMYMRDYRLTGNAYRQNSLDAVPDK